MNLAELLMPYQRRYLADQSAVKICEKSRRIGITWTEALDSVLHAAPATGAQNTWYVGYNREMAREFIDECAEWIARIGESAAAPDAVLIRDGDADIQAYEIRFATRAKIVALSSSPRSLRGKQGRAVIDEAAFHRDLRALLKAALAFRIWGGAVRVISSHHGIDNAFCDLVAEVREGKRPYSLHRYTFAEAIADGLYRKICAATNCKWTAAGEREWIAETYAEYGDDAEEELDVTPRALSDAFLPAALVEARMTSSAPILRWSLDDEFARRAESDRAAAGARWCAEHVGGAMAAIDAQLAGARRAALGVDFARDGDLTVIWCAALGADARVRTACVAELRNTPFRQQDHVLFALADVAMTRAPLTLAMDARGSGAYLCESAQGRYGERVRPVTMARDWYIDAMPALRMAFEDGTIEIPRDADILADLRSLRLQDGVAKPPEKRARAASDRGKRHGDAAIAAALAHWALRQRQIEYAYLRPMPRARGWIGVLGDGDRDRPDHTGDNPARGRRAIARRF